MRATTGLRLLGGTDASVSSWIGTDYNSVRHWKRLQELLPPRRDRIYAAVLRKAAAQALGLTARQWWAYEDVHSAQLEHVLEHQNDALVEFLRQALQEVPPEHPSGLAQRFKGTALATAA